MARKRQRAKDRKQKLHRENVPGSLDHASAEVDQAQAAIVAGGGGRPVEPAPDDVAAEPVDAVKPDDDDDDVVVDEPVDEPELVDDPEPVEAVDDDLEDATYRDSELDADAESVERGRLGQGAGDVAVTPNAQQPAGFRLFNFFRACWAELQRVDWPDRRQVGQATAVVLGFVVVAGAFLGLADVVAQRIVDLII